MLWQGAWTRLGATVASASALVWTCHRILHLNATTAALTMVLLVLAVATRWGSQEAILASLLCGLGFNFYFLPPIGTFTISDPQNWIALGAFLITAVTVGQLSTRAKKRTQEAFEKRAEVERLYRLSRSMLMTESQEVVRSSLLSASDVFGFDHIAFYDLATGSIYGALHPERFGAADLRQAANTGEATLGTDFDIVPVKLGTRVIGSMGWTGRHATDAERDSIANLIAINFARARAVEQAAEADAARRQAQLKTSVLDGIAHDLKTPLTAIKTCITTLISVPPSESASRAELLTIIDEETDHLQKTISGAIDLARVESGNVEVRRRQVNLAEVVRDAVAMDDDGRRYVFSIQDFTVAIDPGLFRQALKQVLENARKYSPVSEPIEIESAVNGSHFVIRVSDRGPGIDPEDLPLIFDKFYRGKRGRAEREGTGLGLSIAQGIVQAHGGSIRADNRPGGGAVIAISFPIKP